MPEEWRLSEVIPIYKNKGDAQTCSNYRGIKLLSYTMKLWERVIDRRLRRETKVSENQFDFMSGRSSMEAIHIIRTLMEKYRERQKDLHLAFLDLEKVIQDMYEGAGTYVRTPTGNSEYFPVDVGLHQGSAISPYLFALILDELSRGIQESIPWNENDQNEDAKIRIGEHILEPKESFRYHGSVIHKSEKIEDDVIHHIQAGWLKMEVAEIRMLRWTCGKTLLDMIPNGAFRRNIQVATIVNKMREGRLRWFVHVKKRPQSSPVMRVESITVGDVRRRGRPKLRNSWRTRIRVDEDDA
ncbi:retrovirus-related pol polyprotein LINE-1 [Tanacetum coccineum]